MKLIRLTSLFAGLIALTSPCKAQDTPSPKELEAEKVIKNLKYEQGSIDIRNGLAKLNIPPDFNYLGADDAKAVLTKIWNNPPEVSANVLGMILPANKSPEDEDGWAVTISYVEEGYVKDDDAGKIDYDAKLKEMQAATLDNNKARVEKGYEPIELLGWATPPHYDAATHKLYWAKELKFGDSPVHTLNYDVRILGRRGYLKLSAIAGIDQLSEIEQNNPKILAMVNFNDGNRYADFDPKIDKVAAYGIGALVLGGIAAKMGLFKLLLVGILALKKFVIIGFVAVAAGIRRLFGRRK